MIKGATLSNDRKYRFELHRIFDTSKPLVAFVGLNPSTADEDIDDPTITKCINYAKKGDTEVSILSIYFHSEQLTQKK